MKDKNYLIVGGSHGIGLGIVKRLVARGGQVISLSRSGGALAEIGGVKHVVFDVMTDVLPTELLPETIAGMVYCPGSISLASIRGIDTDAMLEDYRLNVIGAVKCVQAALPMLKAARNASLVMFSTVAVAQGLPMHGPVSAVKGAVEGLCRAFAAELAPKIRVNCIAPSLTDTPLAERLLSSDQKRAAMDARHPLGRIGTIDDIAAMAEFLLSDQSTWISGQVFGVDGGISTLRV